MKQLTVKEYAELIGEKNINNIYSRIRTIEKWKKYLQQLETESFNGCNFNNEPKMKKLRHKIKDAIQFVREDSHIFIFID